MDSPAVTPGSAPSSNDENLRVKFLCSFSGSILPRPQDGKLRYVGGETRIVSLPRDIPFEELMGKMRELFEGAAILKYQQPDEDLDALVSVVNDDDVTNMMEEYDKLGSGDGFTRLRIFLFAHSDQDGSSSLHFGDVGDEQDNERRYVDALNSLNESPDFRKQMGESPLTGSFDDVRVAEQYFNQMNLEGSVHGQRNMELPMAQMNLRHLTIPHVGSGQLQQQVTQRYSEMEAPWSPAYYSPRQPGSNMDQRPVSEFPASPSSSRYTHSVYEQQQGYPGNILQMGHGVYEGNNGFCEHCRTGFPRNHLEPPSIGNGYLHVPNSCAECPSNREMYMMNSVYTPETHSHERGWVSPHQPNPWAEEPRPQHLSVSGRLPDSYIVENGISIPIGHGNVCDGQRYIHHEDQRYGQVFQDQTVATGSQIHHSYGTPPSYTYAAGENMYQVPQGHIPPQTMWRNVHSPLQGGGPAYEAAASSQLVNNGSVAMGFMRGTMESSPRLRSGLENPNPWAESSSQKMAGFDGSHVPEYSHTQPAVQLIPNNYAVSPLEPVQTAPAVLTNVNTSRDPALLVDDISVVPIIAAVETDITKSVNRNLDALLAPSASIKSNIPELAVENGDAVNVGLEGLPDERLEFLPELIASVKEAALKSVKEVKDRVQEDTNMGSGHVVIAKEDAQNHKDGPDGHVELEVDSDNDNVNHSKIELTKAEAEAIDRGLQTIRNEDLEEIRELGSGTYGSVFHGKWKGSDVAIKRIKASCFAGRPSERERLIADFWKEALILSSLHHPNVVSFYGVVRDGPDGSLATVTEFMVNGSLKQFLQKKDRTIDRRKRLIIAMDSAFGMEYLHGKNIVHFDLKCENLLVNMRDPHRPVCKIGDLGLSKVKQHTLVSGGVRGTLPWMAPELLSGKSNMVTEKIDVYSFGIVMWELLTGDEPYADLHCASIIGGIVNNSLRPQIPTWCDPEWKALMESCWASEPAQRPSFSEISQKLRTMAAAMNLK